MNEKSIAVNIATLPVPPMPDGPQDYTSPITNYVPKTLHRAMSTPEEVAKYAQEGMSLHHVSFEEASSQSGLPLDTVKDVVLSGKGYPDDVIDVLAALGIDAVCLPPFPDLVKGMRNGF